MATNLVPPKGSCIIRCHKCKGLYVPETVKASTYGIINFEKCPFCGYISNTYNDTIPVWKYNLIKFFRSGKHVDEIESGLITFEKPEKETVITACDTSAVFDMDEKIQIQSKKKNHKHLKTPKEDEYWLKITFENYFSQKEETYRFYGIVDSVADLPIAEQMPEDAVYYVEVKKKFCTKYAIWWNFDNDLDTRLYGKKREKILNEAYNIKTCFDEKNNIGKPRIMLPR